VNRCATQKQNFSANTKDLTKRTYRSGKPLRHPNLTFFSPNA
jgi:hypothetical protein